MMDADDIALSYRFEKQLAYLRDHSDVGLLGGAMICFSEASPVTVLKEFPERESEIRKTLLRGNCFAHNTVIFKKQIFDAVGGYRSAFDTAEDYDLWLRIAGHCVPANLKAPLVMYRMHSSQVSFTVVPKMALAALGAKLSEAARRKGEADPALGWGNTISEGALLSEGVSDREIEDAVQDAYSGKAAFLASLGWMDLAEKMLAEARDVIRSTTAGARTLARLNRAAFQVERNSGRWVAAVRSALRFALYRALALFARSDRWGKGDSASGA